MSVDGRYGLRIATIINRAQPKKSKSDLTMKITNKMPYID